MAKDRRSGLGLNGVPESADAAQLLHPNSHSKCDLSRTITQPLAVYEFLDSYRRIEVSAPQGEDAQVDEAYQSLTPSDLSDKDSHDGDTVPAGSGSKIQACSKPKTGGTASRKSSDAEWAKRILKRPTGFGCVQRHQVLKYISQLETNISELEVEVSALSPQVDDLERHRWVVKEENDSLKQKIAELSEHHLVHVRNVALEHHLLKDENEALQRELDLLKSCRQLQLLQLQEQIPTRAADDSKAAVQNDDFPDREELVNNLRPCDWRQSQAEEAAKNFQVQEPAIDESKSTFSIARKEDDRSSLARLVKWPSTLYRSISAIRKDVLDDVLQTSDAGVC